MNSAVYLDYAATTPIAPLVAERMSACLRSTEQFGNPSSPHAYGITAAKLVETARTQVAACINATSETIVFTSGATESANLAIKGITEFHQRRGKHIICCATDHKASLEPCAVLAQHGYTISYLAPNQHGLINMADLAAALCDETILVTTTYVNHETGVIQNVKAIAELAHANGSYVHIDAAQAIGKIAVDVRALNVDLMSVSAHKVYGPKGVGALYIKPRVRLTAQLHGGGQEHGIRSSTLATHQLVGMGIAFALAHEQLRLDQQHAYQLRELLWAELKTVEGLFLNSPLVHTVPHILNVSFAHIDNQALLASLTTLAISSGSACTTGLREPSYVLTSMGIAPELAAGAVRVSLGRYTTLQEVHSAAKLIVAAVQRLRQ